MKIVASRTRPQFWRVHKKQLQKYDLPTLTNLTIGAFPNIKLKKLLNDYSCDWLRRGLVKICQNLLGDIFVLCTVIPRLTSDPANDFFG